MELKQWLTTLSAGLQTTDVALDDDAVHILLDLARDSAHEVERVAAPLTTYLVGIAVGRGASLGSAAATATALLMNDDLGTTRETDARRADEASD
jgi:Domain of unknown function (DUF6457)